MLLAFRALIVGTRWGVGANDEEIRACGKTLMPGTSGQDGDVSGLKLDRLAVVAAKANCSRSPGDAEYLMNAGMVMDVIVDPVTSGITPSVQFEQVFDDRRRI